MSAAGRLRFDDEEADENVGRESAETAEREVKTGVRAITKTGSNPASKRMQRQAIRKQYAAAKAGKPVTATPRVAEQAAKATGRAVGKSAKASQTTAAFARRHGKGFAVAGILLLSLAFLLNVLSSCSVILESLGTSVAVSTYPSEDADMLGAEAAYCALEAELQTYLDTYEETHDYDEYHFALDTIEHDPYVLISMLTAWYGGAWTLDEIGDTLRLFFDRQYILTETVTSETRNETVTEQYSDMEGGTYTNTYETSYLYRICNVRLENFILSHVPVYIMDLDHLSLYSMYMGTLGNRPDLFPSSAYINRYLVQGYTEYEISADALADETFAAMIAEAEKYLGYPYVWGGASPSTSFDCSGFVSWVINHSGWNVGRLSAQGLCDICTRVTTPRPGDLVFFTNTYNAGVPVSHVGIYVGNGWMIHAGDPISYVNFAASSYYQQHFYRYGRLPAP